MRFSSDYEILLFLTENKNEILNYTMINEFDKNKNDYNDYLNEFEKAREEFVLTKTIEFLVFELNMDYNNIKETLNYNLLRKVWEL
ncbi:MAG: hypothetical protein HC836_40235 [Richelia sp. RM2_1_2]|nr:hypothetical protein [Richelia sp. RM2_1_2]